jgi:hypothetical protein
MVGDMLDIGRAAFDFVDEIEKNRIAAALDLPAGGAAGAL